MQPLEANLDDTASPVAHMFMGYGPDGNGGNSANAAFWPSCYQAPSAMSNPIRTARMRVRYSLDPPEALSRVVDGQVRVSQADLNHSLGAGSSLGRSLASIGDLDGDWIPDLVSGPGVLGQKGFLFFYCMNRNGTVRALKGGYSSPAGDPNNFGFSVAALGLDNELDGVPNRDFESSAIGGDNDAVPDLIVGDPGDGIPNRKGSVWLLHLNADSSIKSSLQIGEGKGGFKGSLSVGDGFGKAVASVGDLDGDCVIDVAVGASDANGGRGGVYLLFLNKNTGTVKNQAFISAADLAAGDQFGKAICPIGDLDGDGCPDIAVGAPGTGATDDGAVYVCLLNGDGSVKQRTALGNATADLAGKLTASQFGRAIVPLGRLSDNGKLFLAVGAQNDNDCGDTRGATYIFNVDAPGVVGAHVVKLSNAEGNFLGDLYNGDRLGASLASLGNLDAADNKRVRLVAGAPGRDKPSSDMGAFYSMNLVVDKEPVVINRPVLKERPKISITSPAQGSSFNQATLAPLSGLIDMTNVCSGDYKPLPLDIMLVLDRSGSMLSSGGTLNGRSVSRWEVRDAGTRNMLSVLPEASDPQVGMVTFETYASLDVPLTSDFNQIETALTNIDNSGGTSIGEGLKLAVDALDLRPRTESDAIIVLLSDGGDTYNGEVIRSIAAASKYKIFTIFFGSTGTDEDQLMQDIATNSHGASSHSTESSEIVKFFSKIGVAAFVSNIEIFSDAKPAFKFRVPDDKIAVNAWSTGLDANIPLKPKGLTTRITAVFTDVAGGRGYAYLDVVSTYRTEVQASRWQPYR